jgi:transcriptional regulator with XRE-family HTH domain
MIVFATSDLPEVEELDMRTQPINRQRGERIARAMERRGRNKAMALAMELGVSPAALSKWINGHSMTLENACLLAESLDVSLDWLAMGRNAPDWLQKDQLTPEEQDLLEKLRRRPGRVLGPLLALISEIPERVPQGAEERA